MENIHIGAIPFQAESRMGKGNRHAVLQLLRGLNDALDKAIGGDLPLVGFAGLSTLCTPHYGSIAAIRSARRREAARFTPTCSLNGPKCSTKLVKISDRPLMASKLEAFS